MKTRTKEKIHKVRRNLSTKDRREFWNFVDLISEEVKEWPYWKKRGETKTIE